MLIEFEKAIKYKIIEHFVSYFQIPKNNQQWTILYGAVSAGDSVRAKVRPQTLNPH